jgi:outer membrane biosynthesis protein TonB
VSLPPVARWVLLALIGLAIAIGVAVAAANLTSQQIGIASESVSAGDALAPSLHVPAEAKPQPEGHDHGPEETTSPTFPAEPPTTTVPAEEITPPEETVEPPGEGKNDDSGGSGPDGDD